MKSLDALADVLLYLCILLTVQFVMIMILRRPVLRWFGAQNTYRLWLLPLLWLPFTLFPWQGMLAGFVTSMNMPGASMNEGASLVFSGLINFSSLTEFSLPSALSYDEIGFSSNSIPLLLLLLWPLVSLGLVFWYAAQYLGFVRLVNKIARPLSTQEARELIGKTSLPTDMPVYYVSNISCPALLGIFKPGLLLPEGFTEHYDEDQRHIILSHESIHLKRLDNAWNLLATFLRVVFWFNPVFHIAYKRFRLDQELSCDARALALCNSFQSRHYAKTLLQTISREFTVKPPQVMVAWENLHELKERTKRINQHLQINPGVTRSVILFAAIILAGGGLTACMSSIEDDVVSQKSMPAPREDILSSDFYATINKAKQLQRNGNFSEALALLDELDEMNEAERFVHWQFRANLYEQNHDYDAAMAIYRSIEAIPDLNQEATQLVLSYMGRLSMKMEKYSQAIEYFNQYNALATEPDLNVLYQNGLAHYQLGDYEGAISLLNKTPEPERLDSHNVAKLRRALYLETDEFEKAETLTRTMIDTFDTDEDREVLKSLLSYKAEEIDKAALVAGIGDSLGQQSYTIKLEYAFEILPIVTKQPVYPKVAADENIEGWVLVSFDVTEEGLVNNPFVVDAEPENLFNESALAAISEFRFDTREVLGAEMTVEGVRYLFRYNLTQ